MNAMILKSVDAGLAPLASHRTTGAYVAEIRFEFLRMLRNPALLIPMVLLPVALYLLFAVVIWGDAVNKDPSLGAMFFVTFAVMAVTMAPLFCIGASLAMDRELGLLRLKRAQPAPPASWVISKIVCGVVLCTLSYLPLVAGAIATGRLPFGAGATLVTSLALLVGSIPFCALGLMIGALFKGSSAPGYANLIYLPGLYLSGMFFPLPASMHWQVPIWPQFHVSQLAMHAAGVAKMQFEPVLMALATLAGYTVLFAGVTIWRLKHKG
jgi:ABC-2 type transport system permease protein